MANNHRRHQLPPGHGQDPILRTNNNQTCREEISPSHSHQLLPPPEAQFGGQDPHTPDPQPRLGNDMRPPPSSQATMTAQTEHSSPAHQMSPSSSRHASITALAVSPPREPQTGHLSNPLYLQGTQHNRTPQYAQGSQYGTLYQGGQANLSGVPAASTSAPPRPSTQAREGHGKLPALGLESSSSFGPMRILKDQERKELADMARREGRQVWAEGILERDRPRVEKINQAINKTLFAGRQFDRNPPWDDLVVLDIITKGEAEFFQRYHLNAHRLTGLNGSLPLSNNPSNSGAPSSDPSSTGA